MLWPLVAAPVMVIVTEIPRLPRPDQPATPRTNHATGLNLPTPRLPQHLVDMAVSLRTCRRPRRHVAILANPGGNILIARVSEAHCSKRMCFDAMPLARFPVRMPTRADTRRRASGLGERDDPRAEPYRAGWRSRRLRIRQRRPDVGAQTL